MRNASALAGVGVSPFQGEAIEGGVRTGLTATGSSASDALQLVAGTNVVGTTASSTGVKLPQGFRWVFIVNSGANTLTVYPNTGTVDGSASVDLETTRRAFYVFDDTNWHSVLQAAS